MQKKKEKFNDKNYKLLKTRIFMNKVFDYIGKAALGTIKGAFIGAVLGGIHFYTIDALQAFLDIINRKPQEEIEFKVGNIKGIEIYIIPLYDLYYTRTITPYFIGGSALAGAIAGCIKDKNSKLEQRVM